MKYFTLLFALLMSSFGYAQISLPINFESTTITYTFNDFAGGVATVIDNPDASGINTSAKVGQMVKGAGEVYGGSTLALSGPIVWGSNNAVKMKVWANRVGAPVLFKLEGAQPFEVSASTTVANQWQELTFDFTAVTANIFTGITIIYDLGVVGDGSANFTFYFDDMELIDGSGGLAQVDLPITFQDTATVNYGLTDFGGNASSIVVDPTNPNNLVGKAIKTGGAELWAGTSNGGNGLASPIPFTAANTKMTVRVWSPDAGTPIRLKVEKANDPTISVETEANTTAAGQWETLEFNFSNQAPGTAAINFANTYNKVSIFFNFGTTGAMAGEKTYYWDDVKFGAFVDVENLEAAAGGIHIYPNPAADFCTIAFSEFSNAPVQLSVLDASGKRLKTATIAQQNSILDLQEFNVGLYFLKIEMGSTNYFQKLVIVR